MSEKIGRVAKKVNFTSEKLKLWARRDLNPHTLRYQNLNLAHGIKIELGRLEFAKWKELYRALAIDELCEEVVNDLNLSRRDLAELPDDDHVDARFADLSANGRLLLREVQNVFGTIADAATGNSSVGDPATKKVFEIRLLSFGATVTARLGEFMVESSFLSLPDAFRTKLEDFDRQLRRWAKIYNQLIELLS